jgi:hypothetical protein
VEGGFDHFEGVEGGHGDGYTDADTDSERRVMLAVMTRWGCEWECVVSRVRMTRILS